MRIALDATGGDHAPGAIIEGAGLAVEIAVREGRPPPEITLIAPDSLGGKIVPKMPKGLKFLGAAGAGTSEAGDPRELGENPDSPIRTALRLHREGRFDAVVSAGSTGAQVIATLVELEKCIGITRPAVGSLLPTTSGKCLLLDVGASLVATPYHLVQFAAMGLVYMQALEGISDPLIGVLNVATESLIGDRAAVEAHRLLRESGLNYAGFVEGRDIIKGVADVVVTNGLVGNIILKYTESLPELITKALTPKAAEMVNGLIGEKFDYQAHGGEPLLGVKGLSMICHGASTPRAIASALRRTERVFALNLPERIETFVKSQFDTYFSQVKYLRSFRRSLRLPHSGKASADDGK